MHFCAFFSADMEPDEVLDFEPPSETVCNVCEGKASSAADSEQENIPLTLNTSNLMIQPEVAKTSASQHGMSKLNRSAGGGAASAKAQHGDVSALGEMADFAAAAANSSVAALGEVPSNLEGIFFWFCAVMYLEQFASSCLEVQIATLLQTLRLSM